MKISDAFWVAVPPLGVRGLGLRWQLAQWFELRWWWKYLSHKTKQEYLSWKRNYWWHLLTFISNEVKIDPTKRIVDLGCGPAGIFILQAKNTPPPPLERGNLSANGFLSNSQPDAHKSRNQIAEGIPLFERGWGCVAVDPLIDEYEKELPFFKKSDYPDITFIKSTIEEFNPSQKFDFVFCMNAINHVNNIEKGFETLKKICADDGRIIISIDAHNYSFFKYLFRLLPGDILHPHQFSLREYKALLAKDGWKVSVPYLLKEGGLFNHYGLIARKD